MKKSLDVWYEHEAMHRAAMTGDLNEIAQLIRSGYSIKTFDDMGRTPLHYAVINEHYKIVKFLLDHGADVNAHHEETASNTVITMAAEGCYPEMIELLLSFGADPNIRGWMGLNAFDRAQKNKTEEGEAIRRILAMSKFAN